jgi:DNA-binding MarR family transcriptional regulator
MLSPTGRRTIRSDQIDHVSSRLPARAALVTRLLARELTGELSRTEAGALSTLSGGPRRITELAELEGLAQPTMTILVKQLEHRGLVRRSRREDDGRVVLVELTDTGSAALEDVRDQAREVLGAYMAQLSDQQVGALAVATEALGQLATLLQQRQT